MSRRNRSGWTPDRIARAAANRQRRRELLRMEASGCTTCRVGVHDPHYGDDGVAKCLCCGHDMTSESFPHLEIT